MRTSGIVIVVVGLLLTAFTTFKLFTKEEVVDMGIGQVKIEKTHDFNWSPFAGVVVMILGGIVIWQTPKQ